ncbi:TAXI family TRAP transporter solute-binding subunit [Thermodesulfobacteriota bacterium]
MMVKKCGFIFLSLMLMLSIMSSVISYLPEAAAQDRPKNIKVNIVGFVPSTGMHLRAELVAEALRREYQDWAVKALATPKAVGDVLRHRRGRTAQFFISLMPWALAKQSYGPGFKKRGVDFAKEYPWNPVITTGQALVHFLMLNKTGLTSVKDIVDKKYPLKVGYSSPGGHATLFNTMLEFYGASMKDLLKWGGKYVNINVGSPVGSEMMRAGKIEAGFGWMGVPNPPFLQANLDWRMLPIAEEDGMLRNMQKWGFVRAVIPPGVYPWVKKDLITVAQTKWLGAIPGSMPEDWAYWVAKGVWNQRKFLIASHRVFNTAMNPDFIVSSLRALTNTPHPGAMKFYREQGWIK